MQATFIVNEKTLERAVLGALTQFFNGVLANVQAKLKVRLGEEIERRLKNSPEYHSLVEGSLYGNLGVLNGDQVTDKIIGVLRNQMQLNPRPVVVRGGQLVGGLSVEVARADLQDVLNVDGAEFVSKKGFAVPWLDWLLRGGTNVILADYTFLNIHGLGRTERGFMVKSTRGWSVPSPWQGDPDFNWITRSLFGMEAVVEQALRESL